jgi:hypothetical protein
MCDIIRNSSVLDQCRQHVQSELIMCKADLSPLESGGLRVGERLGNGPWVDVTDVTILGYKRSIAVLQEVLNVLAK